MTPDEFDTKRRELIAIVKLELKTPGELLDEIVRLRAALEKIIDADTIVSDGGKVHDHGSCAGIAIAALSNGNDQ